MWGWLSQLHSYCGPWAGLGSAPSNLSMGPWLPTQQGDYSEDSPSPKQLVLSVPLLKDPPWVVTVGSKLGVTGTLRGWASVYPFVNMLLRESHISHTSHVGLQRTYDFIAGVCPAPLKVESKGPAERLAVEGVLGAPEQPCWASPCLFGLGTVISSLTSTGLVWHWHLWAGYHSGDFPMKAK